MQQMNAFMWLEIHNVFSTCSVFRNN